jgi:uncharacterized damage-inducible protein DinB
MSLHTSLYHDLFPLLTPWKRRDTRHLEDRRDATYPADKIKRKEQIHMTEQASPLATFYKPGWENYQQAIIKTIAPLSAEQLALLAGPQQRSIGELLEHLLGARFNWFHLWMGEGEPSRDWNEDEDTDEPPVYQAASLVAMFEKSWHVISTALDRWTWADLEQLFSPPASHQAWLRAQGLEEEPPHTRQWIVWHVMEHEIHHGGELSLALGTHGLEGFYTW